MTTLATALRTITAHRGNGPAILTEAGVSSWRDFGDRVARAAGLLGSLGVGSGDRFGILCRNSRQFEELKWAGFWLGAIPVPVNWRLAPPEIGHVLGDSDCVLLAFDRVFSEVLSSGELERWRRTSLPIELEGQNNGEAYDMLAAAASPVEAADGDEDDDALLLYTGGTTGRSKGVRLSHRNILSNALAFGLGVGARGDDVFLHAAPMFHSADLLGTAWFLLGAAHAYLPAFSPAGFVEAIAAHQATATVTVPTMLMMTVSDPGFESAKVESMRTLIYGASPMALEWIQRVAAAFPGAELSNCYGLTETAPDLTIFNAADFRAAIETGDRDGPVRSVGKPNAVNELRVVGPDGQDTAPGEPGELWARGPNIMKGYLNLPKETAEALVGGWLRTGDVARIDTDGYVYLLDRLKDLIVTGGENVYSSEVEAALHRHPAVREAAVIGVPDERLGETIFAVVIPQADTKVTEAQLTDHCRTLIGGYKIPRRMAFVEDMPRSALGKVLKAELRRIYAR